MISLVIRALFVHILTGKFTQHLSCVSTQRVMTIIYVICFASISSCVVCYTSVAKQNVCSIIGCWKYIPHKKQTISCFPLSLHLLLPLSYSISSNTSDGNTYTWVRELVKQPWRSQSLKETRVRFLLGKLFLDSNRRGLNSGSQRFTKWTRIEKKREADFRRAMKLQKRPEIMRPHPAWIVQMHSLSRGSSHLCLITLGVRMCSPCPPLFRF